MPEFLHTLANSAKPTRMVIPSEYGLPCVDQCITCGITFSASVFLSGGFPRELAIPGAHATEAVGRTGYRRLDATKHYRVTFIFESRPSVGVTAFL